MTHHRKLVLVCLFCLPVAYWVLNSEWQSENTVERKSTNSAHRSAKVPADNLQALGVNEQGQIDREHHDPSSNSNQVDLHSNNASKTVHIEDRRDIMSYRRSGTNIDLAELKKALDQKDAWSVSADVSGELKLSESQMTDGRYFIESNPLKFESLVEGDRLPINIPHTDQEYSLLVNDIVIKEHTLQWKGEVEGVEGANFIITRGSRLTKGSIRLPEARYVFDIHENGLGWIHVSTKVYMPPVATDDVLVHTPEHDHSSEEFEG